MKDSIDKSYIFKSKTRKTCLTVDIFQIKRFVPVYPEILKTLNPAKLNFSIWISGSDEILEYISVKLPAKEKSKRIIELLQVIARLQSSAKILILRKNQQELYDHLASERLNKLKDIELDKNEEVFADSYIKLCECSAKIMAFADKSSIEIAEQISMHVLSQISTFEPMFDFLLKIIQHDNNIFDHLSFVTLISLSIGKKLGLSDTNLKILSLGCLFMDLGITQMELPNLYTHKLRPKEQKEFEKHPTLGVDILSEITADGTELPEEIFIIILQHHERFNGQGFPNQLKDRLGRETPKGIHILASIVALADKFALYFKELKGKRVFNPIPAINALNRLVGSFDPIILQLFNELVGYETKEKIDIDKTIKWIVNKV